MINFKKKNRLILQHYVIQVVRQKYLNVLRFLLANR